jgi:hypothetical protein
MADIFNQMPPALDDYLRQHVAPRFHIGLAMQLGMALFSQERAESRSVEQSRSAYGVRSAAICRLSREIRRSALLR